MSGTDSGKNKSEFERIFNRTSHADYVDKILPEAEQRLNEIAQKLRNGERPDGFYKVLAIINRTYGRNALAIYPDSEVVREYADRINTLYSEIRGYYPSSPPD